MSEKIETFMTGLSLGCVVIAIGVILFFLVSTAIIEARQNNFCAKIYHSTLGESSKGHISGIEGGYIKCCRFFYEDHELQEECQIFPYTK